MNYYIIGMGYMGIERHHALQKISKKYNLKGYYDPKIDFINYKGKKFFSDKCIDEKKFIKDKIDFCVISLPHYLIKNTIIKVLSLKIKKKIKILIEKPYGLNFEEAKYIDKNINRRIHEVFIGLNYRFFPAIQKMINDIKQSKYGDLLSLHLFMGHGHEPGIENTWQLKKNKAGGGVIVDPGIHLLNLINYLCKNLKIKHVEKINKFWKQGIEEDAVLIFTSKTIPLIVVNLSITKWRSTFEINLNGDKKYVIIKGRDRSYGNQVYYEGVRWGWNKFNKRQRETEKKIEYSNYKVFQEELRFILGKKKSKFLKPCNSREALKTMKLIKRIYSF